LVTNAPIVIATVNVNGIRAAYRRGMEQWLTQRRPDIVLLQEVRAPNEITAELLDGWHIALEPSQNKGRAGVAIASRFPIIESRAGLGDIDAVDAVHTGRWLEADIALPDDESSSNASGQPRVLTVVSAYLHSATNTPEKQHTMQAKFAHLDQVTRRLTELIDSQTPTLVGGDLNIAHRNEDIKNWRGNQNTAGFTPAERAYLTRWFDEIGWLDVGRALAGEVAGPYSWWSWRGQAFNNDAGWRLDYHLANRALAPAARTHEIDRASDYALRFSDHAPVVVTYEL